MLLQKRLQPKLHVGMQNKCGEPALRVLHTPRHQAIAVSKWSYHVALEYMTEQKPLEANKSAVCSPKQQAATTAIQVKPKHDMLLTRVHLQQELKLNNHLIHTTHTNSQCTRTQYQGFRV